MLGSLYCVLICGYKFNWKFYFINYNMFFINKVRHEGEGVVVDMFRVLMNCQKTFTPLGLIISYSRRIKCKTMGDRFQYR